MKFVVIYALCLVTVTIATKECKPNEELVACHNTCEPQCGFTPKACTEQCIMNYCDCKKGFVRDTKGNCIEPSKCTEATTKCPPNELFKQCGTACEPTCKNPKPEVCTMNCILNVCQCAPGYVRDVHVCIKEEECKK